MSKWKAVILHKERVIARKTFDDYFEAKNWAIDIVEASILIKLDYDLRKVEEHII